MSAHLLQLSKAVWKYSLFGYRLWLVHVLSYLLSTYNTVLKRLILVFAWVSYSCTGI